MEFGRRCSSGGQRSDVQQHAADQRLAHPEHGGPVRVLQQQHAGQDLDQRHAVPVPVPGRIQVSEAVSRF